MFGGLENSSTYPSQFDKQLAEKVKPNSGVDGKTNNWERDSSDSTYCLLELAANNDLEAFHNCIEGEVAKVDMAEPWYARQNSSRQMVLEQRTPAMIAALYGSVDVLKYIVKCYASSGGDIDEAYGRDGTTALHCAAAGGSVCAVEAVKILLDSGANPNVLDTYGRRPADVICVSCRDGDIEMGLKELFINRKSMHLFGRADFDLPDDFDNCFLPPSSDEIGLISAVDGEGAENFTPSTSSTSAGSDLSSVSTTLSPSSSPKSPHANAPNKEYPIDPSLPDIKNSIYTTDEFRMYSFKVRPCSRAYSHDWTECPFAHPGENARRRDPRRFHYSCVPCPDFRKGACRRGDTCEYAHGVFECWLHPAQYRTRLCKDGTGCNRRVCFFAHTTEELRPLFVSTGSAVPSPRSSAFVDIAVMSPPLCPSSPIIMPPYSPSHSVQSTMQVTPPMSPSASASNSLCGTWSHSNVPTLHLPGASLQATRLRATVTARNASINDSIMSPDFDDEQQLLSDYQFLSAQSLSTQARLNAAAAAAASGNGSTFSRTGKYRNMLNVVPTNLEDLFASESISSPKSLMHGSPVLSQFEKNLQPTSQVQNHQFPLVSSQIQAQQLALEAQLQSPTKASFSSLGSLSRMSMHRGADLERRGMKDVTALAAARAAFSQQDKRSHSSRDLGAGLMFSEWGSPTGKPEWAVQGDHLSKLRKSSSFGFRGNEEPDLSWVQKLVKEGPLDSDMAAAADISCDDGTDGIQREGAYTPLSSSWIDKLSLDQIVA